MQTIYSGESGLAAFRATRARDDTRERDFLIHLAALDNPHRQETSHVNTDCSRAFDCQASSTHQRTLHYTLDASRHTSALF
jgi:hypothetical protein